MNRRKCFHLTREHYFGRRTYFVTICASRRKALFAEPALAAEIILTLKNDAAKAGFLLHAWCLMPDHLHILAKGAGEGADLFRFITRFKRHTTMQCACETRRALWQRNFYEHILRHQEAVGRVAAYIWMNPVRKGLCVVPAAYPFSGSMTMPWKQSFGEHAWTPPWNAER